MFRKVYGLSKITKLIVRVAGSVWYLIYLFSLLYIFNIKPFSKE